MVTNDMESDLDPIVNQQIYIGKYDPFLFKFAAALIDMSLFISLEAGVSQDLHKELGITHILSVCTDNPSESSNHLTIPVEDSEYEDLLIHMPTACRFIQDALDGGGVVLVHCVMGISRSAAVMCAYCELAIHLVLCCGVS